jgi:hypothetical protein
MATPLEMPKKGASPEEFAAYYKRLKELQDMGDGAQNPNPLPGETFDQYQQRLSDTRQINFAQNPTEAMDRFKLSQLQNDTEAKARGTIGEQKTIADQRLKDLATFLSSEENRKFNQDIPSIAEDAQAKGFLETSGFGNALADRRAQLMGDTSARLTEQGLADRNLEIAGIGGIGQNYNDLATSGLERTYSTEDLTRSEALSRELARLGVVNPKGESSADKFSRYAEGTGALLGGIGSMKTKGGAY